MNHDNNKNPLWLLLPDWQKCTPLEQYQVLLPDDELEIAHGPLAYRVKSPSPEHPSTPTENPDAIYLPLNDIDFSTLIPRDDIFQNPELGTCWTFDLLIGNERIKQAAWIYVEQIPPLPGSSGSWVGLDSSKVSLR
ncbi:DUF427 domain-containing protein [Oceanobacter mangrovi]|uniref:DUF427 domain-containing protein n=1 Tax=Oceanobacter mangrovi TaxID=2862510 RepID=UPI001C8E4955|nr:DUF427 domain-containing protein [Oceanobacter mangrovi]